MGTFLDVVVATSPAVSLYLSSSSSLGWVTPIAIAVAFAAVRPIVSQALRPAVRRVLFERACTHALSAHRALPEQAAEDIAMTVALAERAIFSDVSRGAAALVAGLVALTLGCSLLGLAPAIVLGGFAVVYLALQRPLGARLADATVKTFERRVAWTARIAAAARNDGEIRTAEQRRAFLAAGRREADAFSASETRELSLIIAHRALASTLSLAAVVVVIVLLGTASVAETLRSFSSTSIASLRGVLLFVAAANQLGVAARSAVEVRRILAEIAQRAPFGEVQHPRGTARVTQPLILEARDLRIDLAGRTALGPLSFTLPLGGLIAIAGPNGAGKSTFARAVAGIVVPSAGTLTIDGIACAELAAETMAVVPQNPILLESSTIRDNLALIAADVVGASEILVRLGLDAPLGRPAGELSRGEARRVAIARGLLTDAPILLLDESDAWLDGRARRALRDSLRVQAERRTILLISHREELLRACDRVLLLDAQHGFAGIGTVDELLERSPAMREVLDASDCTP